MIYIIYIILIYKLIYDIYYNYQKLIFTSRVKLAEIKLSYKKVSSRTCCVNRFARRSSTIFPDVEFNLSNIVCVAGIQRNPLPIE